MDHLFIGKKKKENPLSPVRPRTPLERFFAGEEVGKEEFEQYAAEFCEREKERMAEKKRLEDACIARLGYTGMDLEEIKSEGYRRNMKDGVYVHDYSAPVGSIDNPREVGMEGCCTSLFFVAELGGWVLTDGLGNGVLR